ncbi:MAG TPA: phage holin family protein [Pyrinomonadaceae bacterium]|jgi:uncharacterized membrane protein YqjE
MATPRQGLQTSAQGESENLPSLFSRLADDVMALFDAKINLLKVELKQEARTFANASTMMAIGAIVAAIGFALLNVAVAFGVSVLFASTNLSQPAKYALGFLITGFFYVVIGSIVVMTVKKRLSKVEVMPETFVEELRKDKQWLKNEL